MKKIEFTEEPLGLVVKGQRGRSKSRDPKEIRMLLTVMLATTAGNQGTSRKII